MNRCYRRKLLKVAAMVFMAGGVHAQARVDKSGRPLVVMDDSMRWVNVTLIYSAGGEAFYVPDMTRVDWIRSRYQQFAASGTFTIVVYSYHVNDHGLRGQAIDVNLEKHTASVQDFAAPQAAPVVLSLDGPPSPLTEALNLKIVPTVRRELMAYHRSLFDPKSPIDDLGWYSSATN